MKAINHELPVGGTKLEYLRVNSGLVKRNSGRVYVGVGEHQIRLCKRIRMDDLQIGTHHFKKYYF